MKNHLLTTSTNSEKNYVISHEAKSYPRAMNTNTHCSPEAIDASYSNIVYRNNVIEKRNPINTLLVIILVAALTFTGVFGYKVMNSLTNTDTRPSSNSTSTTIPIAGTANPIIEKIDNVKVFDEYGIHHKTSNVYATDQYGNTYSNIIKFYKNGAYCEYYIADKGYTYLEFTVYLHGYDLQEALKTVTQPVVTVQIDGVEYFNSSREIGTINTHTTPKKFRIAIPAGAEFIKFTSDDNIYYNGCNVMNLGDVTLIKEK